MYKEKSFKNPLLTDRNVYFFLFLIALAFVVYRALFIPLFVDEIVTYTHYVKNEFFSPYNELKKANNHLVNTLLTYVSYSWFGNTRFSLRLFNVIALIPYAIFVYKIGLFFRHRIVKWAFYLTSLFTLNVLVYFAMSRGYGLSFTFVIISIYYLIQTNKRTVIWDVPIAVIFMVLALYSNFSLLLFVFISGLILFINTIIKYRFYFQKWHPLIVLLSVGGYLTSIYYALQILFFYKENGILWWGNLKGFWPTTVKTLIHHLFNTWDESYIIQSLIIVSTAIIVLMYLLKPRFGYKNIFTYLISLNVIGVILMGLFFEVNYPFQRTGLHLYLFFIGAFCFAADNFESRKLLPFVLFPMFLIPVHFIVDFNLNKVVDWEEDNLPDEFFDKIQKLEVNKNDEYLPSIHIHGTAKVCWDYEMNREYRPYMPICLGGGDKGKSYYDYLIFQKQDSTIRTELYDFLGEQKTSDLVLYKRKQMVKRELLFENKVKEMQLINGEFYEFMRCKLDSNATTAINVELVAALECKEDIFISDLIVAVENSKTKEKLSYKFINLFTKNDWVKEEPISVSCFIDELPLDEDVNVIVYLWNINKVNYSIHESEAKVHRVLSPLKNE